jgi:hypothetical protein
MIVYDLSCECGSIFEGWFQDRGNFASQQESGLLVCPQCGSNVVRKILSPVSAGRSPVTASFHAADVQKGGVTAETVLQALHTLQKFVENNFEDVGSRLTEESLKIHYGVQEPRNIRGFASEAEEKILEREGIELLKIPVIVKDDKRN